MSAYEADLVFEKDSFGGCHATIAVHDPLWGKNPGIPITADCMTADELRHWGER